MKSGGIFEIRQDGKLLARKHNTATQNAYALLASLFSGQTQTLTTTSSSTFSTVAENYNSTSASYAFEPAGTPSGYYPQYFEIQITTQNNGTKSAMITSSSATSSEAVLPASFGIINSSQTSDTITEIALIYFVETSGFLIPIFQISTNISYNPSASLAVSFILQGL